MTYLNALGSFVGESDPHAIECIDKKKKRSTITGRRIVVAVGGRPSPLECPGAELAISSDDIFSRMEPPGKTLCVGAGYARAWQRRAPCASTVPVCCGIKSHEIGS